MFLMNLFLTNINNLMNSVQGLLLQFLPDIYIYTDHVTGASSGKSPGFGLTLTAETNTGAALTAEFCSGHKEAGDR